MKRKKETLRLFSLLLKLNIISFQDDFLRAFYILFSSHIMNGNRYASESKFTQHVLLETHSLSCTMFFNCSTKNRPVEQIHLISNSYF